MLIYRKRTLYVSKRLPCKGRNFTKRLLAKQSAQHTTLNTETKQTKKCGCTTERDQKGARAGS